MPESGEVAALVRVAEALLLADQVNLEGARTLIEASAPVGRAVRSSVWRAALATALGGGGFEPPLSPGHADPNRSRARSAGVAAAEYLAGGPPVDARHRPYLPARWCAQDGPIITLTLQGVGTVELNLEQVTHPAWSRGRVRELCLHLALVQDRNRAGVAAALWPDREDRSAGQNLRVTLTHLLDVIDPDRTRAGGSVLIIEDAGRLHFNRAPGLHVDLWDLERHAAGIMVTPGHERPSLLAQGRRLLAVKSGPPLGGVTIGEWFEPHRRHLDELAAAAALYAGSAAVAAGDHTLGEALGQRALQADPWSERAHRLVVEARLASGNLDGARGGLRHALEVLDDLGVAPGPATIELARRAGLSPGYSRPAAAGHGAS
jgi:DNA-binding SARP family transcriptional activator